MQRTAAKHVPMRRCVICRASLPQAQLVRLVQQEGGAVRLDLTRRLGGRGTWVCRGCAAGTNEKRLRSVFKGNAQEVARLLSQVQAPSGVPNQDHGGMNV